MEPSALEALYVRHGQSLLTFAYLACGQATVAEDAVQTVFLKMAGLKLDELSNPLAYARRAVANELNTSHRRAKRWAVLLPRLHASDVAPDEACASVARSATWGALADLTVRQRTVVVLRYYEQLSDVEIANIVGCKVATVRSIVRRALNELRRSPVFLDGDRDE